jgi:hypothetical protein
VDETVTFNSRQTYVNFFKFKFEFNFSNFSCPEIKRLHFLPLKGKFIAFTESGQLSLTKQNGGHFGHVDYIRSTLALHTLKTSMYSLFALYELIYWFTVVAWVVQSV